MKSELNIRGWGMSTVDKPWTSSALTCNKDRYYMCLVWEYIIQLLPQWIF